MKNRIMEKIFDYLISSIVLLLWIRDLSYLEVLGVCAFFYLLIRAIDGIVQEFKLDKIIPSKEGIPVYDILRFLFILGIFLFFCICKWIGFI